MLILWLLLSGCGGSAVSSASSAPAAASAKAAAPPSAAASAKPAASVAPSAPAKPAGSGVASAAPSGTGGSVKVAVQGRPDQAALQLGLDRQYFKRQGLNIETVQITDGAQMVPSLSTNQVQVGNGAPSVALFNALNRGIDIRIVADYAHVGPPGDTTLSIVARKDLMDSGAVKSMADLKGRTIALGASPGTISDELFQRAIERDHAQVSDIAVKNLPFPDTLTALGSKSIDAGLLTEPLVTQALTAGIAKVLYSGGDLIPGRYLSVLQYSAEFATKQPDAARRFMVAYLQGVRDYSEAFIEKKNRDAAIKLLTQSLSVKDPRVWEAAGPEYIDPNGKVNTDDLKRQAEFFMSAGKLTARPDFGKYVDGSFAEAAVKELGAR